MVDSPQSMPKGAAPGKHVANYRARGVKQETVQTYDLQKLEGHSLAKVFQTTCKGVHAHPAKTGTATLFQFSASFCSKRHPQHQTYMLLFCKMTLLVNYTSTFPLKFNWSDLRLRRRAVNYKAITMGGV